MNFRFLLLFALVCVLHLPGYTQEAKMITAKYIEVGYPKLGAVKGAAGVIGDNYYIMENDYGGRLDFKNNIQTILSIFSISKGTLIKRVNLNELVATKRKEVDKIIFCDVIAWKDKIIGFYTYKNASAKQFLASAIICNSMGVPEKSNIEIGDYKHDYRNGSFLYQGGLLINGRNILAAGNDFQFRLTADSSRAIVLCAPTENNPSNVKFKIYSPGLTDEQEVAVNIPLKAKAADMVDFALQNDGKIFLAVKAYKSNAERKKVKDDDDFYSDIYIIDTKDGNKVSNIPIAIDGKAFNSLNIALTKKGNLVCFGSYYNLDNKKAKSNIQGFYSIKIDPKNLAVTSRNAYLLPDSVIEKLMDKKAVKKGTGVEKRFEITKIISADDEGIYIGQECNIIQATVRGTTGAMNTYEEVTESVLPYYIDPNGEIKWTLPMITLNRNKELATRTDRYDYFLVNNELAYAYRVGNNKGGILEVTYVDPKTGNQRDKINGEFEHYALFVTNTLVPLGNDEYVMATYRGGDRKIPGYLGVVKFKAE